MNRKPDPPCRGCKDRAAGCHAACGQYLEWAAIPATPLCSETDRMYSEYAHEARRQKKRYRPPVRGVPDLRSQGGK